MSTGDLFTARDPRVIRSQRFFLLKMSLILVGALLVQQTACNLIVRSTPDFECLQRAVTFSPEVIRRVGAGSTTSSWGLVIVAVDNEGTRETRWYTRVRGPKGSAGLWLESSAYTASVNFVPAWDGEKEFNIACR